MTTATAQDRLRQIAILVSSVDAIAARQILMHLPTDKARRVRELANQLGTVSPQEKRKILAEFQRSATASAHDQSQSDNDSSAADRPSRQTTAGQTRDHYAAAVDTLAAQTSSPHDHVHSASMQYPPSMYRTSGQPNRASIDAQMAWENSAGNNPNPLSSSWTQLSPAALLRFVSHERPAVTAVVISQLAPPVAVEVLQHLPSETRRQVLLRLSRLGEIDPEAMQAIDEHLSFRLGEYQHTLASELENSRRMQSLLAAAPADIRAQWHSILASESDHQAEAKQLEGQPHASQLDGTSQPDQQAVGKQAVGQQAVGKRTTAEPEVTWTSQAAQTNDVLDISGSVFTTVDAAAVVNNHQVVAERWVADQTVTNESFDIDGQASQPDLLPFPQRAELGNSTEAIDHSLIQLEFEQILHLPHWMLANLLSQTDSQLVLLALAGATPQFMKRFTDMLDRQDAKALQHRLQRIGPIRLRDVDQAQRVIVENASRMTKQEQLRRAA